MIEVKNVASVRFADNEAATLLGVAAAKTTNKTSWFCGGIRSLSYSCFAAGFKAECLDRRIYQSQEIDCGTVSFSDAAKGKTIAAAQ